MKSLRLTALNFKGETEFWFCTIKIITILGFMIFGICRRCPAAVLQISTQRITYALELTASGLIIQYWAPDLNIGIFIGVFWVLITLLNLMPVNFYG
jgi:amino acid permease